MKSTDHTMPEPLLIRTPDAARMLGVSPRTLANWTKSGTIPTMKQGRTRLYSLDALRAWINARQSQGGQA